MKNDQKFNENKKIRTNFDARLPHAYGFEQAKLLCSLQNSSSK